MARRCAPALIESTVMAKSAVCVSLAVVLSGGLAGCRRSEPVAVEEAGRVVVTAHTVRQETLRDVAGAPGVIVPSAAADWTISAPEAGEIAELPKKPSDLVVTGDVLVRFAIPSVTQEIAARELEVLEATARVDRARAEVTRLAGLVERGVSPRMTYDASRLEQSAAETALHHATAQLSAARLLESHNTIRARFPGVVAEVWHVEGDHVIAGGADPVLRVIDPSQLQVSVQLPRALLARIVPGQRATVRAIAGLGSEEASVALKPPAADPNLATGEVRLAFDQAATLALDTPVSVEILLDQRTAVLTVPSPAVRSEAGVPYVMLVGDDGRAHRREVRLGLVTTASSEVVTGLSAGELVIVTGLDEVVEGAEVLVAGS
jgi:RND family efflux transporter MFP subunit